MKATKRVLHVRVGITRQFGILFRWHYAGRRTLTGSHRLYHEPRRLELGIDLLFLYLDLELVGREWEPSP